MSKIANPLYDTVFKYLMEDIDIATDFISVILERKVTNVRMESRSSVRVITKNREPKDKLILYHLDFKATVYDVSETGESVNPHEVLIELQKGFQTPDIYRFRDYLSEELSPDKVKVKRTKNVIKNNKIEEVEKEGYDYDKTVEPLPIINIYILGFSLIDKEFIIRKPNYYLNAYGEKIYPKSKIVNLLTVSPIFIQIPNIPPKPWNKLAEVMSLFIQTFCDGESEWVLNYDKNNSSMKNSIVKKIYSKLENILADEETRKELKAEEDGRLLLESIDRENERLTLELEESERKVEEEKRKVEEEKRKVEDVLQNSAKVISKKLGISIDEALTMLK